MSLPSQAERAAMRHHRPTIAGWRNDTTTTCYICKQAWPCDAQKLLDALDEAERQFDRCFDAHQAIIAQRDEALAIVQAARVVMAAFDADIARLRLMGMDPGEADTPPIATLRALLDAAATEPDRG